MPTNTKDYGKTNKQQKKSKFQAQEDITPASTPKTEED